MCALLLTFAVIYLPDVNFRLLDESFSPIDFDFCGFIPTDFCSILVKHIQYQKEVTFYFLSYLKKNI